MQAGVSVCLHVCVCVSVSQSSVCVLLNVPQTSVVCPPISATSPSPCIFCCVEAWLGLCVCVCVHMYLCVCGTMGAPASHLHFGVPRSCARCHFLFNSTFLPPLFHSLPPPTLLLSSSSSLSLMWMCAAVLVAFNPVLCWFFWNPLPSPLVLLLWFLFLFL